jgi:DNA-binding Lrp family transcriptional regulator
MNKKIEFERINVKKREVKSGEERTFDQMDKRILSELLADSRQSFRQIARKVGISPGTVLKRIKRLETEGIIRYYTVILDHEKLGYDLAAIIELTISRGKLIDVEKEIAKHRNVLGVYDVTGTTDAMILAKFKTRRELNNFVKKILGIEFVERTNTRVILNTIKEDFRLL